MKTFLMILALTLFSAACSHNDRRADQSPGYTHSDERSSREGTGVQEEEMSSGDPQSAPATNN
ncbi:MAG: hypothetical protein V4598_09760 [Bdellovibrionota bacterium]